MATTEPPLVSFSVMRTSTSDPRIRDTGRFSVNVLSRSQDAISHQFARTGSDKWAGDQWSPTRNQNPVIAGTLMWLDCDLFAEHAAGDHDIVIDRVKKAITGTCVRSMRWQADPIAANMPKGLAELGAAALGQHLYFIRVQNQQRRNR